MTDVITQLNDATHPRGEPVPTEQPSHSWVVSLLFWTSLLLSAVLYAAVSLSPKVAEWLRVRNQYAENARRLVELEDDIDYLERIAATLQSDPAFTQQLARAAMPAPGSDTGFVPVTEELMYGGVRTATTHSAANSSLHFVDPVIRLASDIPLRRTLLITSGILVLVGFTFLNESSVGFLSVTGHRMLWLAAGPYRRYRKRQPPATAEVTQHATAGMDAAEPPHDTAQ